MSIKLSTLVLIGGLAIGSVQAQEVVPPSSPAGGAVSYVLGTALAYGPTYSGGGARAWRLRPVLGLRYGRIRLSSGGASGLLNLGAPSAAGAERGLSAELFSSDRIFLGLGLRADAGRSASDDPALAGLPTIRPTLRMRLSAGYAVSKDWSLSASLSQDALGRGGGATLDLGAGWRHRLTPATEISVSASLGLADTRHMQTYYGVGPAAAATSSYAAYAPGAGLAVARVGVGAMTALSPRWVLFGGVGLSQLQGAAAASPLTRRAQGGQVSIGLAYRCCASGR